METLSIPIQAETVSRTVLLFNLILAIVSAAAFVIYALLVRKPYRWISIGQALNLGVAIHEILQLWPVPWTGRLDVLLISLLSLILAAVFAVFNAWITYCVVRQWRHQKWCVIPPQGTIFILF